MKKVGVVGAGTMGSGIAQCFLTAGWAVRLCDIAPQALERGRAMVEKGLNRLVEKEKLAAAEAGSMLARLEPGVGYADFGDCALVVEASLEDVAHKLQVFEELSAIVGEDCILATNSSSISTTLVAAAAKNPARVVGMHFFNPAPVMKLVEVVRGLQTAPRVMEETAAIARELGKTPVPVEDSPGFVVNRVLVPMINEAVALVAEGVASPADIDEALKLGANHPMGPLALGDLIGLDIILNIMEIFQGEFGEDKYRPHPLLRKMVRAGQLGRKTRRGFYTYE